MSRGNICMQAGDSTLSQLHEIIFSRTEVHIITKAYDFKC